MRLVILKKIALILSIVITVTLFFTSCDNKNKNTESTPKGTEKAEKTTVSYVKTANGRSYVEYLGSPYLFYGVKIKPMDVTGDQNRIQVYDEYFKYAAECGFKSVSIPFIWRAYEISEDVFETMYLETIISLAVKYDVTVQLCWYGCNVGGHFSSVPEYILKDETKYPKSQVYPDYALDLGNVAFIERENKAVKQLMCHIKEFDKENKIMMIQIENEVDNASNFKDIVWSDWEDVWTKQFSGGQLNNVMNIINTLGNTIHDSDVSMVTRHNFTCQAEFKQDIMGNVIKDFFDLDGLDLVGFDIYTVDLKTWSKYLDYLDTIIPEGNITNVPETGAQKFNVVNIVMDGFARGAGSILFELRSAATQPYDLGIYHKSSTEWRERDGTELVNQDPTNINLMITESKTSEIKAFNRMIYKADTLLATLPIDNIVSFNTEDIKANYSVDNIKCGEYYISYSSRFGGEALALADLNGDLILMSLYDNGIFNIRGVTLPSNVEYGSYKNGKWTSEGKISTNGSEVTLSAEMCVRIPK